MRALVVVGLVLIVGALAWWGLPAPVSEVTAGAGSGTDAPTPEVAIRQAYFEAFDHGVDRETKLGAMEGGAALEPHLEHAAANFPTAVATVVVEVREVTLLPDRPDWAAVRFELFYDGGAQFGEQTGAALLDDGRWVVARETMCMVYGWAGATC